MTQTTVPQPNLMIYNAMDRLTPAYTYDCRKCSSPDAIEGVYAADMFDTVSEAAVDRALHIEEYHPDTTVTSHHGQEYVVKFNRSVMVYRNGFLQTVKVCASHYDAKVWAQSQRYMKSAFTSEMWQYEIV